MLRVNCYSHQVKIIAGVRACVRVEQVCACRAYMQFARMGTARENATLSTSDCQYLSNKKHCYSKTTTESYEHEEVEKKRVSHFTVADTARVLTRQASNREDYTPPRVTLATRLKSQGRRHRHRHQRHETPAASRETYY